MGEVSAYVGVALVALGIGVLAFTLVTLRQPAGSKVPEVATQPTQQPSFATTLAAKAPRGYVGWLEKQVVFAGRPVNWTVARILTWKILLAVGGFLFLLLFLGREGLAPLELLLLIAGTTLLFFLPDVMINSRAHDRQEKIKYELPDTLDQMTIAVEAGLGFDSAMSKAARNGKGPLAEELVRVLQDMSIGRTRRDSFRELENRTKEEDLRRFVRAVIQADQYGVAIGDVLRVQAGEMRMKRRQRAEEQAMKVTVKIIFPLVLCLLPVLFIILLTPAAMQMLGTFGGITSF